MSKMKVNLTKKPKKVKIVEGFPGFGMIGTIVTEFLIEHLKTEKIGSVILEDVPAMIAIHEKKLVEPISIHYNKEYNIIIIHAITGGSGLGWDLAEVVTEVAKKLEAKEIISIEGVGSTKKEKEPGVFYYSNKKKVKVEGAEPLKEGIIVGSTGALLVSADKMPITAFFAETDSKLPDSKAAAEIIKRLDKYVEGMNIDPKPLLKQAEEFEEKLKQLASQGQLAEKLRKKKKLSYVG